MPKTEEKDQKALVRSTSHLPAEFLDQIQQDAVVNPEHLTTSDVLVPFLKLAQPGSDEIVKPDLRIPGLGVGEFYVTATKDVIGETATIVPCYYRQCFQEWVPKTQGGGFRGYVDQPKGWGDRDIVEATDHGTEIIRVHEHYVLVLDGDRVIPCVLSFKSTGLKISKAINALLLNFRPDGWKATSPPKRYAQKIVLGVSAKSNEKGNWFLPNPVHGGLVPSAAVYETAKEFADAVGKGQVVVEQPTDEVAPEPQAGAPEGSVEY